MKVFDDCKNKQEGVWSNVLWHVKFCIFWNYIQYTKYWDKTQIKKQLKTTTTKNASEHQIITVLVIDLRFLYKLKRKARFSLWDFPFSIKFRFYWSLYLCSTKCMDSLTLKRHDSIQNPKSRKATHIFAPKPLLFKLQEEVLKFNDICVSWSSQKLTWWLL